MTDLIRLTDRVVLSIEGPDAETFLNGLLTNSTLGMEEGQARYGALLAPQGKIISDMIYQRTADGFLMDVPDQADETLLKRLTMFRLRAKAEITRREDLGVFAFDSQGFADPRSPDLPLRSFKKPHRDDPTSAHSWRAARIMAGIPQQGHDFSANEVFPADINMDINHGVDFKKGCFIGQEVVSRMKRRGTARRRTLAFRFENGAPHSDSPLKIGETAIGALTSVEGDYALARVRLDRMAKAMDEFGDNFCANGRLATLIKPDWMDDQIAALTGGGE
ncbi:MAG: folate-binding protein YgfZ [Hirschia sp.]|nr:folate-binding protein YgfZ [Hirschia sp.]MBF18197.1 folate-binding protein YgfZ [Hirschia sp.]